MPSPRLIFDSHLDLSWNALSFNRDLTQSVEELRRREQGMNDHPARARCTTSLPELRKAGVAVSVATLLARSGPEYKQKPRELRTDLDFSDQSIAYAMAHGQLSYYRLLAHQGHVRMINTASQLNEHWERWQAEDTSGEPLGFILSMEGGDPIVEPEQLEEWWNYGLRALGPSHYGKSHYSVGTGDSGPFSERGLRLLAEMDRLGMILDTTHLSDPSFFQALDHFSGNVLASHQNSRALVPSDRQMSDEQFKLLIERDAVIGVAFDAWMMMPGWQIGKTSPEVLSITAAADQIDHVCQLAGNTRHSAIGTDLDGGFGTEQCPGDLDTINDLHKLEEILAGRGYSAADIDGIFHGNWLRFFRRALPA